MNGSTRQEEFDYVAVGGGLQTALIVLALRARRPRARIAVVEKEALLGGNHTWCFHEGDLTAATRKWIQPLVVKQWPGYDVLFPGFERRLDSSYAAINSERLHEVVSGLLQAEGSALFTGCEARELRGDEVVLDGSQSLRARLVIDARGPAPEAPTETGFQKFVGQELRLREPHDLDRPILMDARVDQSDGYRFMYALPFADDRVLLEDTFFNNSGALDADASRGAIRDWCAQRGWEVTEVIREERGVLPMPWSGGAIHPGQGVIEAGYRGGWFHPGTGYSLPVAARLAEAMAAHPIDELRAGALRGLHREHERQAGYCHLLNRLLFRWYSPAMRRHVFARFYRLPQPVIDRFYALRLNGSDRVRLLVGRPPRGFSPKFRFQTGARP